MNLRLVFLLFFCGALGACSSEVVPAAENNASISQPKVIEVSPWFKIRDTNGDLRIDESEYLALLESSEGSTAAVNEALRLKLKKAFKEVDTNGDGSITPAEADASVQNAVASSKPK